MIVQAMVAAQYPNGLWWNTVRFNPDGTLTRYMGIPSVLFKRDNKLRILDTAHMGEAEGIQAVEPPEPLPDDFFPIPDPPE